MGCLCTMTTNTHPSARLSWLALLCACFVMLAWAAPVMVADDMPDFLRYNQDHQMSDLADVPTELEDASDDPVLFVASSKTSLLPVTIVPQACHLTTAAWSPTSPVRPPNNLPSI